MDGGVTEQRTGSDVTKGWSVTFQAMELDFPKRRIVTSCPWWLIGGRRVPPIGCAHTPAERVREVGVVSEAVAGAEVVLREFFTATLSARPQSHWRILPALSGSGSRDSAQERSQQQSVPPAAEVPGRGSASTPPAPPRPPQPLKSMASELQDRCPICLDSWEEASYVLPCLHQFCFPCIRRWAASKPECPLCKRRVMSIVHSVRADDDFEECVLPLPAAASHGVRLTAGVPADAAAQGLHGPEAPQPPAAGHQRMAALGGFHVYGWAFLFRVQPDVLDPLLPWLQRELGQLVEDARAVLAAQGLVIFGLRCFGLDEGALIQVLQVSLGWHTRSFVRQLIDIVMRRCSEEARQLGNARGAGDREGSPEAAPGLSASRGGSPAPRPDLQGGSGSSPNAPVGTHGGQAEPQEDAQEPVPGSSAASHSSQSCPGRPRRALKRRAGSPQDPCQPPKKPPRWQ